MTKIFPYKVIFYTTVHYTFTINKLLHLGLVRRSRKITKKNHLQKKEDNKSRI